MCEPTKCDELTCKYMLLFYWQSDMIHRTLIWKAEENFAKKWTKLENIKLVNKSKSKVPNFSHSSNQLTADHMRNVRCEKRSQMTEFTYESVSRQHA